MSIDVAGSDLLCPEIKFRIYRPAAPKTNSRPKQSSKVDMNLNQVTLPALDVRESAQFFRGLGFTQITDADHFSRFECPDGDSTFSVHVVDTIVPETGVVVYFEFDSAKLLDEFVTAREQDGYTFKSQPKDERWLWREARIKDPSNNEICFFFAGVNRKNPPWKI